MDLVKHGVLEKYGVEMIGANAEVIAKAEDRELFKQAMLKIGLDIPRGTTVRIKGQVESMESSFRGLGYGLIFAVLLVYLLMVVNFQSWLDPFVILMALPGSSSDCRTKTSDALVMNVPQKQKTHLPEYMAVGSLQSWSRELLESWLPIQTRRGGRHRWVRTTTNAGQLDRSHSVTRIPNSLPTSQSSF